MKKSELELSLIVILIVGLMILLLIGGLYMYLNGASFDILGNMKDIFS